MIEKYKQVFNYFGYDAQRRKLLEEVLELNDAILLFEKGNGDINDVIEEVGDVFNVLNGFILDYNIQNNEIKTSMEHKLNRTVERIETGYYGARKSD